MCVKVSREMKNFNTTSDNFSNLTASNNNNFNENRFALPVNYSKIKTIKPVYEKIINTIIFSQGTNVYYLFMIILMFYIIGYIGLLRLFNDSAYFNVLHTIYDRVTSSRSFIFATCGVELVSQGERHIARTSAA